MHKFLHIFFGGKAVLLGSVLLFWLGMLGASLHAEPLKEIQQRGILRVGIKNNLPLLGFADRNGTLSGYEIELAQLIATAIWGEDRVKVDFIPLLNQERLPAIANGTVDIAIANIHITDSRRRVVAFSQPYLDSQTSFASIDPVTLTDIKNRTIGVLQGSVAISRVRSMYPTSSLLGVSSYQEAIQKLKSREIDLFAGDRLILKGWQFGSSQSTSSGEPWPAPTLFYLSKKGLGRSQLAIAMPKGLQHRNLHQAINLALNTLESSGLLQQMRNKWRLSEADGAAVVTLDTSLASAFMPMATVTTNVLSTRYGSIIHLRLFDSPVGVACSRGYFDFSTSAEDSSCGKKPVWTSRKAEPI